MMKIIILAILFIPIVYLCLREKKWYLFLFFSFYGILPETFAIEISSSVPLLTASRLLLILVLVMCIAKDKFKLFLPKKLIIFIGISLLISLVNFVGNSREINKIFNIILEQLISIIIVVNCIEDKEEIDKCIDFMILGGCALAVIGMIQTLFNYDVCTVLQLVEARSKTTLTDRMGITRAAGTFNAIIYGSYCSFILVLTLYKYAKSKKAAYIFAFIFILLALFCSMSRSSLLPFVIIALIILVRHFKEYKKVLALIIPIAIAGIFLLYLVKPEMFSVVTELYKSILATLGIQVDVSSQFGNNIDASTSRLMQFSAFEDMFEKGVFLFGFGYQAFTRGLVYYFYPQFGSWSVASTLDVGVVSVMIESGIIGLINWAAFFVVIYLSCKKSKTFTFEVLIKYILILYFMLNILTACLYNEFFWLIIILYFANDKIKRSNEIIGNGECVG